MRKAKKGEAQQQEGQDVRQAHVRSLRSFCHKTLLILSPTGFSI
jgi:hypothetical protein